MLRYILLLLLGANLLLGCNDDNDETPNFGAEVAGTYEVTMYQMGTRFPMDVNLDEGTVTISQTMNTDGSVQFEESISYERILGSVTETGTITFSRTCTITQQDNTFVLTADGIAATVDDNTLTYTILADGSVGTATKE